jgi:uncharacterized protein YndB with AHSA1/START domain
MSTDAPAADLGYVTVTRDFDAPREVVFGAFMDPGQLARFWGPTGTHVPPDSVVIEPFAGGRFEATIVADDGSGAYPFRSTFVEITPPEMFSFREGGASVLSTATFTDLGNGRTRVVIEQSEVPPTYRSVEGLAGFATTLELLADHLTTVATGSGDRGLTQVVVASADGIRITRDFAATVDQVWAAWTNPAAFAQWFGTRAVTIPADRLSWQVEEGNDWAAVMVLPDGAEISWRGRFALVDAPKRLEFTLTDQPEDVFSPITVELSEVAGGTRMVVLQGGGFMPAEGYRQAGNGWGGFFDVMADLVASGRTRGLG